MSVSWTEEQQRVIDSRNENLLVSAAAGSGKTAVLVERILSLVTDRERPMDIDRLLIVTFTRAAAAEMRERIGRALEARLEKEPDNVHLQRQSALLQHAHISTIHSFCTSVIRNYCHLIDLDPACRVADEGELRMLQGKVLQELLEEQYAGGEQAFRDFADAFAPGRSDRQLEALIQKVSDYAASDPDPDAWLDQCVKSLQAETGAELQDLPWMQFLMEETARLLEDAESLAEQNLRLAGGPYGPAKWLGALQQDLTLVRSLRDEASFGRLCECFRSLAFAKLSSAKAGDEEDPALRAAVKAGRDAFKKILTDLKDSFFFRGEEEIFDELSGLRSYTAELVRLTKAYRAAFARAKRKKNICDYDDLEHFALEILLERDEDGCLVYSRAAREMALQFDEIMIDEYQDSNYIQEALLSAVAGAGCGRHNRFMVGDIKQSIYGFRNARPDLFLEKFDSYGDLSSKEGRRIDLRQNFRSRPQVLDAVNLLFRQIMHKELGGIVYDDSAALRAGNLSYPELPAPEPGRTELLLVETASADADGPVLRQKQERIEAEARAAAGRLRELMKTLQVTDSESGTLRPLRWRDCAILLRSAAGWADTFVEVLKEAGIPAYTLSREGYFSAPEVVTVLNCLRVTDNPRWEIPLAGVLRSPAVGCTDRELALIRIACPDQPLYDAVCAQAEGSEKLTRFLQLLGKWRKEAPVLPVHELIRMILEDTGYGEYAAAMPGGAQRRANLQMLAEKAAAWEQGGDSGLFSFIRYMERMQKYSVDEGEVSLYSETEDIVRVTTIHKSKGLEYPVVIVSGLGKRFNRQDQNDPVVLHPKYGAGLYAVDPELRVRRPSLLRQVIRTASAREMLSEEMRILYVAMTRAREKLILTGTVKDASQIPAAEEVSGYHQLSGAASPLDWVLQAGAFMRGVQVRTVSLSAEAPEEDREAETAAARLGALRSLLDRPVPDNRITEFLERCGRFRYPFEEAAKLPAKMTVTEIKKASIEAMQEESGEKLYPEEEVIPYIPDFMKTVQTEETTGAARGTVYHHVLELLDYGSLPEERSEKTDVPYPQPEEREAILAQLAGMTAKGQLKKGEAEIVDPEDILTFLHSATGVRMRAAARLGKLWREQPFVLDVPAKEIDKTWPEGENILVQGVIDAWFEENGSYVLVDYKTDRVYSADGHDLRDKYAPQLLFYRRALETITGIRVKEMYLYSVTLGREIPVT